MKNIHILPTDKPSRLVLDANNILVLAWNKSIEENAKYKKNIYITNDEEIKEDDYYIKLQNRKYVNRSGKTKFKGLYKDCEIIILTTDQDLIKDGVQAIDDEFLEWFVKNPSCEYVEVEIVSTWWKIRAKKEYYKIIIPKEEPKQETLEEAAMKYSCNTGYYGFKKGAKWQQDKNKYSEEEVKNLTELFLSYYFKTDKGFDDSFDEWFEQFKKK